MRNGLMAGASRFAQFSGLTRGGRRADDNDRDDKSSKRSRAEGDDEDKEDKSSKRSRAADEDDREEDKSSKRSRRADDDEDRDDKSSKRSRAEDDEEDDDKDEMTGRSAAANARRRERARCAAIFEHPAAVDNVALAASLAFETSMTRKEAIAVLMGQAGRGPSAHDVRDDRDDRRSRRNANLGPGGESRLTGPQATTAAWDRTLEKVGATKPR